MFREPAIIAEYDRKRIREKRKIIRTGLVEHNFIDGQQNENRAGRT